MSERWLVTGALGCIGSWVVRVLCDQGAEVTTFDLDTSGPRLDLIVGPDRLSQVRTVAGDIRAPEVVRQVFDEAAPTHVVHLAALQLPFCRADPTLGAQVNVVGTVNVFEAAANSDGAVRGLVYASSIAALDALDDGTGGGGDLGGHAGSLYGVYKRANEGTAHVYWQDHQLPSLGLRPHTVYGPGRDQGMTSQPTQAMMAAVRGEPYEIGFGGRLSMQYVEDVANDFIAAARAVHHGAHVANVGGTVVSVAEIVAAIGVVEPASVGAITHDAEPLPLPEEAPVDRQLFTPVSRTSLQAGVRQTMEVFAQVAHQR